MAGQFLRAHGIDIDAEMALVQNISTDLPTSLGDTTALSFELRNVTLADAEPEKCWTLRMNSGQIESIEACNPHAESNNGDGFAFDVNGALALPSLCHPHVHLDKAFLLSHPRYADLQVSEGTFKEALSLTEKAKARYTRDDLLERGRRVIEESTRAGVTHMRAFVEVDAGVQTKCVDAGIELKQSSADCTVQLCAFAQLPLFSPSEGDESGEVIRRLVRTAAVNESIEAIGSTPYVETDRQSMERNVDWMIDLASELSLHLDFHLDYNADRSVEPLVWYVVNALEAVFKTPAHPATVALGHCTRLTLFDDNEWRRLASRIREANLPISFVGLPTSDLYMMRTEQQPEIRATLHVPKLIQEYGLNACIGINNIGNAFTPYGSCDPLCLAFQGVGIYQAGTQRDTDCLFEAISTRAKSAIGFKHEDKDLTLHPDASADFVLFVTPGGPDKNWHSVRSVSDAVYLYGPTSQRLVYYKGRRVSSR